MAKYVECMASQLDLFTTLPVQSNILRTDEVSYKPVTSITNNTTIEFTSLGHGDTYRDLSSMYLRLLVRLKKSLTENHEGSRAATMNMNGEIDTPGSEAKGGGVVNNVLHSLFKQCTIYLNGTPISQSDNNYAYRAYLETVLNYDERASGTHLVNSGFIIDTPGYMNSLDDKNIGYVNRKKIFAGSNLVELVGKVHGDMLNQHKLLINNVDLRVVFSLEKPEFYTLEDEKDTSIMEIVDATLYLNHITVNPGILLAHEHALSKRNAIYNYKRVEVKSYTVAGQNSSLSLDSVIVGIIPSFLIFAILPNDSYVGKRSANPFYFLHYSITNFYLTINGVQVPSQPLVFDYDKSPPISTRGYSNLFKNVGIHYRNHGNLIKKQFFDDGCFLLCFDLTNDQNFSEQCANLLNQGTIRIDARFAKPLPHTVTCLVYAEYDACLEINQARQVIKVL